jgi:hypothetical protein
MTYKDGAEYYGTHYWWDVHEREYTICAKWRFEKGYDIPDSWHLLEWEVESVDPDNSPFSYVYDPKVLEASIIKDGAENACDMQEVDYYE